MSAAEPIRLLVLEDSPPDYALLLAHLQTNGYAVYSHRIEDEHGLREALAQATWDAVIADHELPRFSSGAALAVTKADYPDLPVLIVSSTPGEDVAVDAMLAGADNYITKGRLGRLVPALKRSLQGAEARRRRREVESALSENRARLSAIAADMPGAVCQFDYNLESGAAMLTYISEGTAKVLGITHNELMADPGLWLDMFSSQDREELERLVRKASEQQHTLRWEGRLHPDRLPAGERRARWLQLAATPRPAASRHVLWDGVLTDITQQKRTEGILAKSQLQLHELSAHLERAKEEERAAIAREIHDDIGGTLTGLRVDLAWLKKRLADDLVIREKLDTMGALVDSATAASSRIMLQLRPSILDQGLVPAIEWQLREHQKRLGVQCDFSCNDEELELETETATALFRVLQETLTNIAKHAQASRIEVHLFADPSMVSLEVRDNGVGITDADRQKPGSFGIRGVLERVRNLDGWIEISGGPSQGTTIMLAVPNKRPPIYGDSDDPGNDRR